MAFLVCLLSPPSSLAIPSPLTPSHDALNVCFGLSHLLSRCTLDAQRRLGVGQTRSGSLSLGASRARCSVGRHNPFLCVPSAPPTPRGLPPSAMAAADHFGIYGSGFEKPSDKSQPPHTEPQVFFFLWKKKSFSSFPRVSLLGLFLPLALGKFCRLRCGQLQKGFLGPETPPLSQLPRPPWALA